MEISQNFERQRITSGYILNPKHCADPLSYGFDSIAFTLMRRVPGQPTRVQWPLLTSAPVPRT
jgi:hypothetical protein